MVAVEGVELDLLLSVVDGELFRLVCVRVGVYAVEGDVVVVSEVLENERFSLFLMGNFFLCLLEDEV